MRKPIECRRIKPLARVSLCNYIGDSDKGLPFSFCEAAVSVQRREPNYTAYYQKWDLILLKFNKHVQLILPVGSFLRFGIATILSLTSYRIAY
jgi:hypothetical protein